MARQRYNRKRAFLSVLATMCMVVLGGVVARATPAASVQQTPSGFTIGDATDPLLSMWSLALQPTYFQYRHDRGSLGYVRIKSVAQFDLGLRLPTLWTRLQWPVFDIDNITGPVKAGVGDMQLLLLGIVHNAPPWGKFGIGPVFVFPTAAHPEMGRQSYQVGPAFGWSDKLIEGWRFGFLGQEFLSYAGHSGRTGVNRFRMQPFILKYLSKAWYVETKPAITVNFENNTSTVPLNLTIGRLVSRRLNVSLQADVYPDWTNTPTYSWRLRMSISYLFRSPL